MVSNLLQNYIQINRIDYTEHYLLPTLDDLHHFLGNLYHQQTVPNLGLENYR
nr:MAG TPA: hypothetical protein [Caudoviricetes sp.]